MAATAARELEHAPECWTRAYWLRHCEGYGVESPAGRIGHVDEVVCARASGEPVALRVRGRRGTFVVPVERIREILPSVERIVVDDDVPPRA
jgi:hypothetical protein